MISETKVVFRGLDHSQAVEDAVHKRVEKLERFSDEIQSLRVTLETPHNNHHKGKVFHIGIEAFIPNHEIVVNHEQHDKHSHEDIYVAIRDAFNAIERQLKNIYAKQRKIDRTQGKMAEELVTMSEMNEEEKLGEAANT